uniref:Uncharacterized protein n=1 Tax=Oryza glumipatula TaxID=40148 RepID=A0A0D9YQU2_9ORYZ
MEVKITKAEQSNVATYYLKSETKKRPVLWRVSNSGPYNSRSARHPGLSRCQVKESGCSWLKSIEEIISQTLRHMDTS